MVNVAFDEEMNDSVSLAPSCLSTPISCLRPPPPFWTNASGPDPSLCLVLLVLFIILLNFCAFCGSIGVKSHF